MNFNFFLIRLNAGGLIRKVLTLIYDTTLLIFIPKRKFFILFTLLGICFDKIEIIPLYFFFKKNKNKTNRVAQLFFYMNINIVFPFFQLLE